MSKEKRHTTRQSSLKLDENSSTNCDDTIRRLKLLSKAQTSLLKAHLHTKLDSAKKLTERAISALKASGHADTCRALEDDYLRLDLSDLVVDVTSTQLQLHSELATLRNSIDGDVTSLSKPEKTDGALSDKIKHLESENQSLRGLLKESKAELLLLSKKHPSHSNVTAAANEESPALLSKIRTHEDTIDKLTKQVSELSRERDEALRSKSSLEKSLADSRNQSTKSESTANALKEKEEEIRALKESIAKTQANENLKDKNLSQLQDKIVELEKVVSQLKESHKAELHERDDISKHILREKLTEIEAKHQKEKEGMIDAMAQEVTEVEEKYKNEIATLMKENKKMHKAASKYKTANKSISSGVIVLKKKLAEMKSSMALVKSDTKQQISTLAAAMKNSFSGALIEKLANINGRMAEIQTKYKREMIERKRLHNMIQELKGNIRVFMRCRPPSEKELESFGADTVCVSFPEEGQVKVVNEKQREKIWEFDDIFGVDSTQQQVYNEVSDLITSVLDGYNVCIFAYGQTGSGKTFTMIGPENNRGVNMRALEELFERAAARSEDWIDTISVNILEVYNEEIRDLLVSGGGDEKLEVRQGDYGNHVPGLTCVPVNSLNDVQMLLQTSDKNRSMTATNLNEHSSRSHMMLTVHVTSEHRHTGALARGKLNLVDLAGSERINKSGATGQALKEAQNINKSLSALGDVIQARATKQAHVPFRNSTLTYLLQDSLSQDSKTLMIVCISPVMYNSEETFCSLNFASRVRSVELGKASKNVVKKAAPGAAATKKATR